MQCIVVMGSSLAAVLVTVICVVLTLKVKALKEANVAWILVLVLLLMALLIPTIIIWRQPQSNARLNFKVSAASKSSAPKAGAGSAGLAAGLPPSSNVQSPETRL